MTNNTDADISGDAYIGCLTKYLSYDKRPVAYYAVKVPSSTFRAGASLSVEYTLKAGHYLYAFAPEGVDISAIGSLTVHEPVAEFATSLKSADVWTVYPGDETTTSYTQYYQKSVCTDEVFAEDTLLRVSIRGVSTGGFKFGCCDPATPNKVYYAPDNDEGCNIADGGIAVYEYTVKAGYALAMYKFTGTAYIERS